MAKNTVGIRKDYQSMYDDFIRSGHKTKSDYQKFYRKLAKAADSRLIELERLQSKKGYKDVLQWAYKEAQYDIRGRFGENATRFDRKLPDDIRKMKKTIKDVLRFLNAPTSTKTGIEEIYNKRVSTVNDKYGVNVNWQTIGNLYTSAMYKKGDKKYGSKTTVKAIGVIQANAKLIKKAFKDNKPISLQVPNDQLEKTVNSMLRYYKKDITKLLKDI